MKSFIFKGEIFHQRTLEKKHGFKYKLFMLSIDLDELPHLFKKNLLWSYNKRNIASLQRKDYHSPEKPSLKKAVLDTFEGKKGFRPNGDITLITHGRYFGICFNPVSFYYLYNKVNPKQLEGILCEIENTPWGERHCYAFDLREKKYEHNFRKSFHVSPFMPQDIDYKWHFKEPGENLFVKMLSFRDNQQIFTAHLNMKRHPLTTSSLNKVLYQYPLMTLKVFWGIYWNAFVLWLKKISFYKHPNKKSKNEKRTS